MVESDVHAVAARLRAAGCVAAVEEADELIRASEGGGPGLEELLARRCAGEPLAWVLGSLRFCGEQVVVHRGVYVPRWQSEALAREAVARLPPEGLAVDLCTGTGAIAVVLGHQRPRATVLATEIDPVAAHCARVNGVEVYQGDMAQGLPSALVAKVDVVTAVVPYVPTGELRLLPRDVLAYEPPQALDGGPEGIGLLVRAAQASARLLAPGGSLLVEIGGNQARLLDAVLGEHGYGEVEVLADADGDARALFCRLVASQQRGGERPLG